MVQLGDGQFYLDGALTVNTPLLASLSEFTLESARSIGGAIGGQFGTVEPQGWDASYDPTSVELIVG